MFMRFTRSARQIVTDAEVEARALGSPAVGAEHLLVATLRRCPQLPWSGLPPADAVRRRLASSDPDAEALATIGISLADVRRAVEETFGPDAWDAPRQGRRLPFSRDAKVALEYALREALDLHVRRIDHNVLLLGLIREEGPARRLLAELGVLVDAVRDRIRLEYAQLAR
jgi:ATP-dependent Clp protease ATP-binding subunit ClpA